MKTILLLFIVLTVFSCSSCSDENSGFISFANDSEEIFFGQTTTLALNFSDEVLQSEDYICSLSKEGIADVVYDNHQLKVTGLKVGETELTVQEKDGGVSAKCTLNVSIKSLKRCVVFGNSMTKHPLTSFWWGEWGMAATVKEKDFCHVLQKLLEDKYDNDIEFEQVNVAGWENNMETFNKSSIDKSITGNEDVVVIRLGENVPETALASFQKEFSEFVGYLKAKSPNACFLITGNFWTNKEKDKIQKAVADEYGCMWVTLDQLDILANKTSLDTKVYGDDGVWHLISEGGEIAGAVAAHPGDLGMEKMAQTIFTVLTEGE